MCANIIYCIFFIRLDLKLVEKKHIYKIPCIYYLKEGDKFQIRLDIYDVKMCLSMVNFASVKTVVDYIRAVDSSLMSHMLSCHLWHLLDVIYDVNFGRLIWLLKKRI